MTKLKTNINESAEQMDAKLPAHTSSGILRFIGVIFIVSAASISVAQSPRDIMSDTWTATDALGRSLPDSGVTGPPKGDKFLGIFYFLWSGRHGEQGPFDVSKILAADPGAMQNADSPLWGPMYVPHHWGESLFGYYVADDDFVLRKHSQMLADAGIDVVIFDVTNQETYPESWKALCRVFAEERKKGNRTPQIAFLTPFWDPGKVVRILWTDLYGKGEYSELWFRWKGKPLILADPSLLQRANKTYAYPSSNPAESAVGETLGQSFTTDKPVSAVAISSPTWKTNGAVASLAIYRDKPGGEKLSFREFTDVADNAWLELVPEKPLEPGTYYLELTRVKGRLGWWSDPENGKIPGGEAFSCGKPVAGSRSLRLAEQDVETEKILDFFTFRRPQPDYFQGPTGSDQWAWLEVHPQHGFYDSDNVPEKDAAPKKIEQVAVGIGHNAVDGKLGVLSNPRSHGRSFHKGRQPPPEECDFTGRNFAEQWTRAFELDPEFVFITGWNEWIMGRFPREAPFHGAKDSPVNFVDQFNLEFSRDIEPMNGGHGDAYYWQMIAMNRRFKGTRALEPLRPSPIKIDGDFSEWSAVTPEYRDTIGDPVRRNYRGWGKDVKYINDTGRNDIIAAKISFDKSAKSAYFYVQTSDEIIGPEEPGALLLFLNTDDVSTTGWLGYDYMIENGMLKKHEVDYRWKEIGRLEKSLKGRECEISVPFEMLGLEAMPKSLRFKWADGIKQTGEWSDFTLNGDAAPNDRYDYRVINQ